MLPIRKISVTLLGIVFAIGNGHSQEVISKADGVFFNPEYCAATLFSDAHVYRGLKVKINLATTEVRFVKDNSDEIEMSISFRIKRIEFVDCGDKSKAIFQSGFPVITSRDDKDILYQVLDSGKVTLLKSIKVIEKRVSKDVGYSNTDVRYEKHENYYAYVAATNAMVKIERSKEGIVKLLADKTEQVEKFVTDNNLRFKVEAELIKVIAFYNSLY